MKLFDLHSHWGTRRGYVLRTDAELAQQRKTWGSDPKYVTEDEMATYLRKQGVRAILDFGFTKSMAIEEVQPFHDYAIEIQRRYSDVIFGHWLQLDPHTGRKGVQELRRCIAASAGFIGVCVSGGSMGYPASDAIYDPFYEVSLENDRPVLVSVGFTGTGAGLPGGKGVRLELCHPRYIDELSIRFPELKIIAAHNPWPWAEEMLAVMLHKPNTWIEFHGWSPKYVPETFRREISRRLQDRVLFGAGYPLFTYERLVADWKELGYSEAILRKLFVENAVAVFPELAQP